MFSETFTQWVIEDRFAAGRPPLEEVGAQFVDDVAPYEFMKLRLLNASHLAVAGLGRLAGYVTIDEAMADPVMTRYMAALMDRETGPTLPDVPGINLAEYKRTLIERFGNTAIKDTVERVNTDAPLNILVDPIRDRLRAGAPLDLLALALAAWLRRVRGEDEDGQPIDVRHPMAALLRERAAAGGEDPAPLLGIGELFGETGADPRLVAPVGRWLSGLYRNGSRATPGGGSQGDGFLGEANMPGRQPRSDLRVAATPPVFEHVVTEASDTFLWRHDDYPCERNGWNIHPEHEIHLVTNAAGVALVGDHIGRFEPGHLSIVGGSLPHDWVTDLGPGEVIRGRDVVLQFDADRVGRAGAAFPELLEVVPFLDRAQRGLAFHGGTRLSGAGLLKRIGPARGVERLSLFVQLLQVLSRSTEYSCLSSERFTPVADPAALDLIQRILGHMLDNFTADIRIGDLARMAGMNESTFSRFFKRNTGNTFTDHVTKLRVSRACNLLAHSSLPVTSICYEVGYSNISNFNRNFRRQRGSTPSAYRRLAQCRAA